jgi:hypothetical protein
MWHTAIVDHCLRYTVELRSPVSVVLALEYATEADACLAMGRWQATFGDRASTTPALLADPHDVLAVMQLCRQCLGLSNARVPKSDRLYALASRSTPTAITVSAVLPKPDFKPLKRLHSRTVQNDSAAGSAPV